MAVKISTYATATYGTAGSAFGSIITLNVNPINGKTLNAANYPILAGQLPALAWLTIPAGTALEFTPDGGTTWTQVMAGLGSGIWYVDGFTSRIQGGAAGVVNATFIAMKAES